MRAAAYAATLHGHSEARAQRLQTPRSRAHLVRRGSRPKANGPERPGGMPARADQLVP
jgi:hypothetical protein